MNWFRHHAFGSHPGESLIFGVIILFSFVLCITSLRIVVSLLMREGDNDESEKAYWREHGE